MRKIKALILLLFISSVSFGQNDSLSTYQFNDFLYLDTIYDTLYPFVDYSKNNFKFYTKESPNFEVFYKKFKDVIQTKKGKLNLYHIGGSHLQADIYTHDIRTFLQENWEGLPGERGWVFPFNLAKSNNPGNYRFTSDNHWTGYRSVKNKPKKIGFDYGISGYIITCADSAINLKFKYRKTTSKPPIQRIRIFHNIGEFPYDINFGKDEILIEKIRHDKTLGMTDVFFTDPIDSFDVQFVQKFKEVPELELYGFLLTNNESGFSYNAIGVNGAGLYTYLDNIRFEEQLKIYPPDFFAYSVGTNDGNVPYNDFKPEVYRQNLEEMIQMALRVNPHCALLLTVPNDSYYRRRYLNRNIAREREMIIQLAEKYQMAVWDLYGIMGELGSSKTWRNNQLMRSDLIHFTFEGYHFKSRLFIDAFMKFLKQFEDTYDIDR